jgi:hypothetical protein
MTFCVLRYWAHFECEESFDGDEILLASDNLRVANIVFFAYGLSLFEEAKHPLRNICVHVSSTDSNIMTGKYKIKK